MTLEEAIQTALEYEEKVRDVYVHARADAINDIGRRVFKALAKEEQGHVDYLYQKLAELQNTGQVTAGELGSTIPSPEAIKAGVEKLENRLASDDRDNEIRLLKKALQVEVETSGFYKQMVKELDPAGQKFFSPFLEIEEGHVTLVQAELDCVSGTGFWFDMQEFSLEM
jgi:rubrerythrin